MTYKQPLRAWAEIDLDALARNIALLQERFAAGNARIMAVIKANAYGHGVGIVAPVCYQNGIRHFGVATTEEGLEIRALLPPDASIYILSPILPSNAASIVEASLITVVSDIEMATALSSAAIELNKPVEIHLDIDTGIGRSGVSVGDASCLINQIDALPGVSLTGISTHFASADEDPEDARAQQRLFSDFLATLENHRAGLIIHASNSPASLVIGEFAYYSLLRPGLLLYGIEPAPGMLAANGIDVRPVLSIRARVTLCRTLPEGATISYGKTYCVPLGGGRYATIGIGYGDGFPRRLGNLGYVLLHGLRAPICGRVCMDQFVVNVTDIPDVAVGDVATIVGCDGGEEITAGALAEAIATTPHEISTCLTPRLPRIAV